MVEEAQRQAAEARALVEKSMEDSELGRAIAAGDMDALKKLGVQNMEEARAKAEEAVKKGQELAAEARASVEKSMEDSELGKAIAAGDLDALQKMGVQSVEEARKKAEEALKQGQEAAVKTRLEFNAAIESNDVEALKKYGIESVADAKKKMDSVVQEAAKTASDAGLK